MVELVIGRHVRGNSEVSAQKAKYTICFVGYIVNVLVYVVISESAIARDGILSMVTFLRIKNRRYLVTFVLILVE